MIRVGYQPDIGKDYKLDEKFKTNIKELNKLKIPVGVYFYSKANSNEEAIKQAKWVRNNIKDYDIDMPVAFDWENFNRYKYYKISFYHLTEMANAFLNKMKEYGYDTMLYSNKSCLIEYWYPIDHDIWLAHYVDKTNYEGKFKMWQLTETGRISGIDQSTVDINVLY